MAAPVGKQTLTAVFPALAEHGASLGAEVEARATALHASLGAARSLHFARVALIDEGAPRSALLFGTTYDGPLEAHLEELWRAAGQELVTLFARCEGWVSPGSSSSFERFVRAHARSAFVELSADAELTVERIRADGELRRALSRWLTTHDAELRSASPLEVVRDAQSRLGFTASKAAADVVARGSAPSLWSALAVGDWFALALTFVKSCAHDLFDRISELWHDTASSSIVGPRSAAGAPGARRCFSHLARVKPGRFRHTAVRFALRVLAKLTRARGAAGNKAELEAVHAARCMLLEDGRLLFLADLDGTLESALGRAAERARWLIGLLWSHTLGFPPSLGFFLGGARDLGKLRAFAYAGELRTPFCYCAYPELSSREVRENAEIRRLFQTPPDDARARRLLALIRD